MVFVDGEAADEFTNQHELKYGLNYTGGGGNKQQMFRFTVNGYNLSSTF